LSVRFAESDNGDDHALLLSPWPESLFAFEPTWARLAERTHLVAIDLPGFGHSQRRDELLSPRAMGEFEVRVADAFGLGNPHLLGPDVRTGASLFAAALRPSRFVASLSAVAPRRFRCDWAVDSRIGSKHGVRRKLAEVTPERQQHLEAIRAGASRGRLMHGMQHLHNVSHGGAKRSAGASPTSDDGRYPRRGFAPRP
jgi:pimeloyl-ACP methyl ester carboxylesterase